MPVTVPPSLLIVLQVLRPCFTAPSFVTLAALVTGALSGAGRRTVTGMWQAAGLAGRVHWSRAHRFFARAVWDLDQVGLALARAVVARLVPDGGAVTVAVDDTLFHRYGKKVHGAKYQHDGSARGRDGIGRGNCFVIVGVVAAVPFLARQVCLPVLFRLHIPKTSASKTEQARAMVDLLARPCPGAPSTWWRRPASADRPGAACPPASLHHPPGRQRGPAPTRTRRTGRRGHPAWKGERLGTAAEIAAAATWRRTRVTRYGTTEDVDMAVVTCLWWAACTAPPSAWSWSAAPARPGPTPWPRPPPTWPAPAGRSWPGTPPAGHRTVDQGRQEPPGHRRRPKPAAHRRPAHHPPGTGEPDHPGPVVRPGRPTRRRPGLPPPSRPLVPPQAPRLHRRHDHRLPPGPGNREHRSPGHTRPIRRPCLDQPSYRRVAAKLQDS